MKFRYYITDLINGEVVGTNSTEQVTDLRTSEEHFIVDSLKGLWLTANSAKDIPEIE